MSCSLGRLRFPNQSEDQHSATHAAFLLEWALLLALAMSCHCAGAPVVSLDRLDNAQTFSASYKYSFALQEDLMQLGSRVTGQNLRLKRVLTKLAQGQPIKVGALGGSITYGAKGVSKRGTADWFSVVSTFLKSSFGNKHVECRNGAVSASRSTFHSLCLEERIDVDSDLVFVDSALNDWDRYAAHPNSTQILIYEQLIRKILSLPNHPALILVQFFRCCSKKRDKNGTEYWVPKPFHETTLEDRYGVLAQYYQLPVVSLRNAIYLATAAGESSKLTYNELFDTDVHRIHPNDKGHKYVADLVVYMLYQVLKDMAETSITTAPRIPDLPAPMYPGNEGPANLFCLLGGKLQATLHRAQGFNWTSEVKYRDRYGYIGNAPGDVLELTVPMQLLGAAGKVQTTGGTRGPLFMMYLAVLVSYEHMGKAKMECVDGCSCTTRIIDAHDTARNSQTFMAWTPVTLTKTGTNLRPDRVGDGDDDDGNDDGNDAGNGLQTSRSSGDGSNGGSGEANASRSRSSRDKMGKESGGSGGGSRCNVRVTVLSESRTKEHKFKVTGLMATGYVPGAMDPFPLLI